MKQSLIKKRRLILFTVFLLFCALPIQAAQIPVLDITAKNRPQQALNTTSDNSIQKGWISLGNRGNITAVKRRVGKLEKTAGYLPNIKKQISSRSVIIMDAATGDTIFSIAPDNPRQPASTIKVLTGMNAIKSLENNETVGVSRHA